MKQTIKYKLNPNFEQEKHLHSLCFFATKLYNTDNFQRRQVWEETGKIPNAYTQKKLLKDNHWFKLLPSQTAQEVSFVLQQNYKSWFSLRKKDSKANPPRFRKKESLSPITFYQQFKIVDGTVKLSMSRKYSQEEKIKFLQIPFIEWKPAEGMAKMCQIIFDKGKWFAHIVYEVPEQNPILNDKVMAVDLGIINTATTVDTNGNSKIYSGRQILAIQHYFNKERAKLTSILTKQYTKRHHSKNLDNLARKQSVQINHALHIHAKSLVNDCRKHNIKTLVTGDIKDIRKDKNFGHVGNQKLHSWAFNKFVQYIEYLCIRYGIRFVRANEAYTSQTCSICGDIKKSNRKHRGLYHCKKCGNLINADVNGAKNILKKYLRDFTSRSIGNVAMPLVERTTNVCPS